MIATNSMGGLAGSGTLSGFGFSVACGPGVPRSSQAPANVSNLFGIECFIE